MTRPTPMRAWPDKNLKQKSPARTKGAGRVNSKKSWPIGLMEAEKAARDKSKQVVVVEVKEKDYEEWTNREVKSILDDPITNVEQKRKTLAKVKQGGN